MRTDQDDGERYDQLLGGDGNLISDLNDLSLDLALGAPRAAPPRAVRHASFTYSFNSQHEERVNQGGNGNPTATIGHEPERTPSTACRRRSPEQLSARGTLSFGGDVYIEG